MWFGFLIFAHYITNVSCDTLKNHSTFKFFAVSYLLGVGASCIDLKSRSLFQCFYYGMLLCLLIVTIHLVYLVFRCATY